MLNLLYLFKWIFPISDWHICNLSATFVSSCGPSHPRSWSWWAGQRAASHHFTLRRQPHIAPTNCSKADMFTSPTQSNHCQYSDTGVAPISTCQSCEVSSWWMTSGKIRWAGSGIRKERCFRLQIPRCSNSRPLQSGLPLVTDCSWLPTAEWRALGSVTNWHEQPPPQASPPNHPLNSSHRRHPHAWPPWVFPVSDVPGGVTEHQPIHFLGVQDVCRQVGFLCGGGDSGSGKSLGLFVSSDKIYTIQPSGSFTKQSNFMVLGK